MKILHCFGTRACAIKMSPLWREAKKRKNLKNILIWSGQHFSKELYENVFKDLELPRPDYNIGIKGNPTKMASILLKNMEKIIKKEKPDVMFVHGDTYSAMFYALSGLYNQVPVVHIEAGLRTGSWEPYPEQSCTRIVDSCSSLFFAATEKNKNDLLCEKHDKKRIFVVGNTVIEAVNYHLKKKNKNILQKFKLKKGEKFIFFTVHRKENLMSKKRMIEIFEFLAKYKKIKIIFALLPSTEKAIEKYKYWKKLKKNKNIIFTKSLTYTDTISLLFHATAVLTDSGGLQEEICELKIPCLTLRKVTDRPESVEAGFNELVEFKKTEIEKRVEKIVKAFPEIKKKLKKIKNPYKKRNISKRIIDITLKNYKKDRCKEWGR